MIQGEKLNHRLVVGCSLSTRSEMAHGGDIGQNKRKLDKNNNKTEVLHRNPRVPTNIYTIDTGTCISLVGETQHCESNAFTELFVSLIVLPGSTRQLGCVFFIFPPFILSPYYR